MSGRLDRLVARSADTAGTTTGVRPRPAARFETVRTPGAFGAGAAGAAGAGAAAGWLDDEAGTGAEGLGWPHAVPEGRRRPPMIVRDASVDSADDALDAAHPPHRAAARSGPGTISHPPVTGSAPHAHRLEGGDIGDRDVAAGIETVHSTGILGVAQAQAGPAWPPDGRGRPATSDPTAGREAASRPAPALRPAPVGQGREAAAIDGTSPDSARSAGPMRAPDRGQGPVTEGTRHSATTGPVPDDAPRRRPLLVTGPTPDLSASVRTAPATNVIEVTIGRLDVRAAAAAARPTATRPAPPPEPGDELRSYLRSRARRELR